MLITHEYYTIDTVKIVSIDSMSTLNVAHQQLTQPEGERLFEAQADLVKGLARETRARED